MREPLSPYVGLEPYTERDEPFFFGRSKERRSVAFNLRATRLTVMYGPSGVGKSSLLNAGVCFDLHKLAQQNQRIYSCPELIVVVFRDWHDDPIATLTSEITKAASQFIRHEEVHITPHTLSKTVEWWSHRLHSDILIILDQFEDYFVNIESSVASVFAQQLAEVINSAELRANLLISIREDALSKLDVFKSAIPSILDNYLRIDYLRANAAREVIREPIRVYNERTHAVPLYIVEPLLVDAVIRDILIDKGPNTENRPEQTSETSTIDENGPIAAPLLQMVMRKIWDEETAEKSHKLRLSTLHRLGNTIEIVTRHLEAEMHALPDHEKEVAAQIFNYLVTPSGWKVAHTVQDLAGYTKEKPELLEPVLSKLTDSRILRQVPPPLHSNVDRFEIFHEVYIAGVLGWLSRYNVAKETAAARVRIRHEEMRLQREGERARRRARTAAIILAFVFLVAVTLFGMAVYAFRQTQKARQAEEKEKSTRRDYRTIVDNLTAIERELPFLHTVLRGHTKPTSKALFNPDGSMVATISEDGTARLWKSGTGESIGILSLESPSDIAFSSEGLLAIANSKQITLWNPITNQTDTLTRSGGRITRLAFDPKDPRYLASGDDNGTTVVWDVLEKQELFQLSGYQKGPINDVEWSPQGTMLVTASGDNTAWVWNGRSGSPQTNVRHDGSVNSAVFSPDGKELLTASDDLTARIWNATDGAVIRILKKHSAPVYSAEFSKDRMIVTASADRTARLWDSKTRAEMRTLPAYSEEVRGAHFSPGGAQLITWGDDRTSRVWDVTTGKLLYSLVSHISGINYADFSPDGKLIVTASSDHNARVWNVGSTQFKVKDVRLTIDPSVNDWCPAIVRLFGRIEVEGASGIVKYRFVNQGVPGPERALTFDGPGSKDIGAFYKYQSDMNGSVYLWVTSPESVKSRPVAFHVKCSSAAPKASPSDNSISP